MDEKKIIYEIIKDIWELMKNNVFEEITEEKWDVLIEQAQEKSNKYKECDEPTKKFFTESFLAIQNYGERKWNQ